MNTTQLAAPKSATTLRTGKKSVSKRPSPLFDVLLPAAGIVPMSPEYVEANKTQVASSYTIKDPGNPVERGLLRLATKHGTVHEWICVALIITFVCTAFYCTAVTVVAGITYGIMKICGSAIAGLYFGKIFSFNFSLYYATAGSFLAVFYLSDRFSKFMIIDWKRTDLKVWQATKPIPTEVITLAKQVQYFSEEVGVPVKMHIEHPVIQHVPDPFLIVVYEKNGIREEAYITHWW